MDLSLALAELSPALAGGTNKTSQKALAKLKSSAKANVEIQLLSSS
jgi:hypothetical protein